MRINFYAVYKNFLLFKDTQIINLFIISLFIVRVYKMEGQGDALLFPLHYNSLENNILGHTVS